MGVQRFLAIDLGAGSGRALLGELAEGSLQIRELHRFHNEMIERDGHLHWDVPALLANIKQGIRLAAETGELTSIGVDTWGVDFGLLDEDGELLSLPFTYRDKRTEGAMDSFFAKVPREKVYELTGIQILPFNTLYQLEAMVRDGSPLLARARSLLFMPDLFHYLLTGERKSEFSFATTSQLFNPHLMAWHETLLAALPIPKGLLQQVVMPGTLLGNLTEQVAAETGAGRVPVVAVATHDTGSAVAASPAEGDDWAFLSSGTWSLMGVESTVPIVDERARRYNFTNEGGVGGTFRVLKNIAGMWLFEQCRHIWRGRREVSYEQLIDEALAAPAFVSLIDPDSPEFLNPSDMPAAICDVCRATGQPLPDSDGAMVRCILESLALKYRIVLEQLREISPRPIGRIHVIGGGAQNKVLCGFTAEATGLPVLAGPIEATAIGNLLVQAIAAGTIGSLAEMRAVVRRSFTIERYEPQNMQAWEPPRRRFAALLPR